MIDEYGVGQHDTVALPPEVPETGPETGEEQGLPPEQCPPGEILDDPGPENPFNSPAVD